MKTKVCNKCYGAALLVSTLLAGCVPGEATISVKSSELAKAVAGRIGWADVTLAISNVYENVELSAYPKLALDVRQGEMTYGAKPEGVFDPTNRLSDVLSYVAKRLNECLPDFFCRDESLRLSSAVVGTNAVISIEAKLKVPIGKSTVLEEANLPRVMQLELNEEKWSLDAALVPASRRLNVVSELLRRCLYSLGYARAAANNSNKAGDPPSLKLEILLNALTSVTFVDTIRINQEADDSSPYALKSVDVTHDSAECSHIWISGGGLMSGWERSLREKMVPTKATDVVFQSDEHSGRGMTCLFANTTCRIGESDFLAFAESKNYLLATNSFVNIGSEKLENGHFSMSTDGAVNFISCCDIQNNGGGIHLIYDRDKKILRGFYSHH